MILCLPNGSLVSVSITNGPWSRWSLLVMGSISNHISILGTYVSDRKAPGGCFSLIHHAQRENRTEIEELSIQSKNRMEEFSHKWPSARSVLGSDSRTWKRNAVNPTGPQRFLIDRQHGLITRCVVSIRLSMWTFFPQISQQEFEYFLAQPCPSTSLIFVHGEI